MTTQQINVNKLSVGKRVYDLTCEQEVQVESIGCHGIEAVTEEGVVRYIPFSALAAKAPQVEETYFPGDVLHSRRSEAIVQIVSVEGGTAVIQDMQRSYVLVPVEGSQRQIKRSSIASSYKR